MAALILNLTPLIKLSIELRSESGALEPLRQKMQEYLNQGMRSAWRVSLQNRPVIYRANQANPVLDNPAQLRRASVPGFQFNLSFFWDQQ